MYGPWGWFKMHTERLCSLFSRAGLMVFGNVIRLSVTDNGGDDDDDTAVGTHMM